MELNIIISGNLTGFSRFYSTSNANELYTEAKLDFDYRNSLTFLNNEEKAYAISFTPDFAAVSLITRILDSFRRPGILVVTTLIPRNKRIESVKNPQSKDAIYQLLNEVNARFYEKNFLNGMINQNAAVLMQDYYSEILSNYKLSTDTNQRLINKYIDTNSTTKKTGYIKANENDVPSYLSSIYRKSYEGYHQIFLAQNAPQNIDEPPVEVIMYRVYITNEQRTLPGEFKLTDKIYKLEPRRGKLAISNQDYTYEDILSNKAGGEIKAIINGETIEITYNFKTEEKTITFVFHDQDGEAVDFYKIAPEIEDSKGHSQFLPNETYTFTGEEIYEEKQLKTESTSYRINPGSCRLNLQYIKEKYLVRVDKCSTIKIEFYYPDDQIPKTIRLIHRNTKESYTDQNITSYFQKKVPGKREEWDYEIISEEYETIKGSFKSDETQESPIEFKRKKDNTKKDNTQQNTTVNDRFARKENNPITTTETVDKNQQIPHPSQQRNGEELNNGQQQDLAPRTTKSSDIVPRQRLRGIDTKNYTADKNNNNNKRRLNLKKVFLVIALPACIILYFGIGSLFNFWPWADSKDKIIQQTDPLATAEDSITKVAFIKMVDNDGNKIDRSSQQPIETINVEPDSSIIIDNQSYNKKDYCYQFETTEKNKNKHIHFTVLLDSIEVAEETIKFEDIEDTINLWLNISASAFELYQDLWNINDSIKNKKIRKLKQTRWDDISNKYDNINTNNSNFKQKLQELYDQIKEIRPKRDPTLSKKEKAILDGLDCTLGKIAEIEENLKKNGLLKAKIDEKTTAEERIKALKGAINTLKNGFKKDGKIGFRPSTKNLSKEQIEFINRIFPNNIEKENKLNKKINNQKKELSDIQSMKDFEEKLKEIGIIPK